VVALTEKGRALRARAGCLAGALLTASGESPQHLNALNRDLRELRNAIYAHTGDWTGDA
jgi:hypothetical protein